MPPTEWFNDSRTCLPTCLYFMPQICDRLKRQATECEKTGRVGVRDGALESTKLLFYFFSSSLACHCVLLSLNKSVWTHFLHQFFNQKLVLRLDVCMCFTSVNERIEYEISSLDINPFFMCVPHRTQQQVYVQKNIWFFGGREARAKYLKLIFNQAVSDENCLTGQQFFFYFIHVHKFHRKLQMKCEQGNERMK